MSRRRTVDAGRVDGDADSGGVVGPFVLEVIVLSEWLDSWGIEFVVVPLCPKPGCAETGALPIGMPLRPGDRVRLGI